MRKLLFWIFLLCAVLVADLGAIETREWVRIEKAMAANELAADVTKEQLYASALASYYSGEYHRAEAIFTALLNETPPALSDELIGRLYHCYVKLDQHTKAEKLRFKMRRTNSVIAGRSADDTASVAGLRE